MKKRVITCFCVLMLLLSLAATTAFAAEKASVSPKSARAAFSFSLSPGASSSYSAKAYKDDYAAAEVYPQEGAITPWDQASFRVRDANRQPATNMDTRSNMYAFSLSYLSGKGNPGYYYLYASAPSTNYDEVNVSGVWYP